MNIFEIVSEMLYRDRSIQEKGSIEAFRQVCLDELFCGKYPVEYVTRILAPMDTTEAQGFRQYAIRMIPFILSEVHARHMWN